MNRYRSNQKGEVSNIVLAIGLFIALVGAALFIIEFMAMIGGKTFDTNKIVIGVILIVIGGFLEKIVLSQR